MRLVGLVVTVSLLLAAVAQAATTPSWQWRSEMPRWNQLKAVAYGDGRFVAVGDAGTVLTSTDGTKWTAGQTDLPSASLTAVAYGDGRWVALAHADARLPEAMKRVGLLLTSVDGLRWTEAQRLEDVVLQHVAHGDGRFLVTGYAAVVGPSQRVLLTSTDGAQWTRDARPGASPEGIAYGAGLAIAIGSNELLSSTDGLNWESRFSIPADRSVAEVIYTGSRFVAVGSQSDGDGAYIVTSADGRTWQPQTAAGADRLYQVAARGSSLVALGIAHLYRSADGISWKAEAERNQLHLADIACSPIACVVVSGTEILTEAADGHWRSNYDSAGGHISSIAYGDGQFLAISGDRLLRSDDGLTWADAVPGQANPWAEYVRVHDVTYGNGWYVAHVTQNLTHLLYRSKDGKSWEQVYERHFSQGTSPVRYAAGRFFFLDQTSVDGQRWEKLATPHSYPMDLVYGQGQYLVLTYTGQIYRSVDGMAWNLVETNIPLDVMELRESLAYGRGRFVMVREDLQKLFTSTDGATWSEHPWPFARQAPHITYQAGLYLAAAGDGFWTSTDGITWSTVAEIPNAASVHLAYGKGQVIAAGMGGVVFTGQLCGTAFSDLPAEHPACTPVELLANRQVIGGFPDGTFRPEAPVTRAELAKLMTVLLDRKPAPAERLALKDTADHWAAQQGYIQTMVALGAVNGFPDGTFRPESSVTRAQLIKIVAALAGLNAGGTVPYADVTESHWYHDSVSAAAAGHLIGWGAPYPIFTDEALRADAPVTRAEAAAVLANLLER